MRYARATALIVAATIMSAPAEGRSPDRGPAIQPGSLLRTQAIDNRSPGIDAAMPDPRVSTFGGTLRYASSLGDLARRGFGVPFRGNLASREQGFVDLGDAAPRPTYWVAQLWRRLMGDVVLDPGSSKDLHVYAHCRRGVPGGVVLLVINDSRSATRTLHVAGASQRYTLSGHASRPMEVRLNGRVLRPGPGNAVPMMAGVVERAGAVRLPPATITFLTIPYASNKQCRAE